MKKLKKSLIIHIALFATLQDGLPLCSDKGIFYGRNLERH